MSDDGGFLPEEIERGEDRPGCTVTMHPIGCAVLLILILGGLLALMFYNGMFMHGD